MSPRWGGPKWPRRRIPVIRRPKPVWIANGAYAPAAVPPGVPGATSSLQASVALNGSNTLLPTILPAATAGTSLLGPILSTFDASEVEVADTQSINQADALADSLRILRIQGFIHYSDVGAGAASPTGVSTVGFAITKEQSINFAGADAVDLVDPTVWRSAHEVIHMEFRQVQPFAAFSGNTRQASFRVNLRTRFRLDKNEYLLVWFYHEAALADKQVNWAFRTLCAR